MPILKKPGQYVLPQNQYTETLYFWNLYLPEILVDGKLKKTVDFDPSDPKRQRHYERLILVERYVLYHFFN